MTWKHESLGLKVTAFASGDAGASLLHARYRVENPSGRRQNGAALPGRATVPGAAAVAVAQHGGRRVADPRDPLRRRASCASTAARRWSSLSPPDQFGATAFEETAAAETLASGHLPAATETTEAKGFAAGVLGWDIDLAPGESREVLLAIPFHEPYVEALAAVTSERAARTMMNAEQAAVRRRWQTLLSRVEIDIPAAPELVRTAKTTLAYTLINRDHAAIQPGSRTYARSWIRDGAVTSAALLQMGFPAEVREFIRWYAGYQLPDGKIPCCIDRRGADGVPEHDSAGQFVWLVGEYYRYTRDVGLVADLWPSVTKALDYLVALRAKRTTDAYRLPQNAAYFGLLPESISHEGYSSHPVHAYWDQFWALAGLRAAPQLANIVGDVDRFDAYVALRDAFEGDLVASVPRAMAMHAIDYVPGSVELGDYDPTSTAIAVNLFADDPRLRDMLDRTFTRYMEEIASRRAGTNDWVAYSPYELRNVEALVLLGRRADAQALLEWIMADRRPPAWNQWAEISYRDAKAPQFIGDMPHTWVGCIFVHALRTMLVRERDRDRALVIGAGVPADWMARGVSARRLPTASGILSLSMKADGEDAVRVRVTGDVAVPPGGIVITSPYDRPIRRATLDGRPLETVTHDSATVDRCPADVMLYYEPVHTDALTSDGATG